MLAVIERKRRGGWASHARRSIASVRYGMSEGSKSTVVRHALGLPRRLSVRYRLLGLALLPTMILVPALLGLGAMWWAAQIDSLLISKVNGDLTVARQYLN